MVVGDAKPDRPAQYGADFTAAIKVKSLKQVFSLRILHIPLVPTRNQQNPFY